MTDRSISDYHWLARSLLDRVVTDNRFSNAAGPKVIGVCGAQGTGKSTLAEMIAQRAESDGMATAVLSIDDLYRTRSDRRRLAREIHPLLVTRGVPGTHEPDLGVQTLSALRRGATVSLPRFDKGVDDRVPESAWPRVFGIDLVVFEGWCVGVVPQPDDQLVAPVNMLEQEEDADGVWRRWVNDRISDYRELFALLDHLTFLAAPDIAAVKRWRLWQESERPESKRMNAASVDRFVAHYERLTVHMLSEMPDSVDVFVPLDEEHQPISATFRLDSVASP